MTSAELRAAIQGIREKRDRLVEERADHNADHSGNGPNDAEFGKQIKECDAQVAKLMQAMANADRLETATAPGPTPRATTQMRSVGNDVPANRPHTGDMPRIVSASCFRPKAFRGAMAEPHAFACGQWLKANLQNDADAQDWLRRNAPAADMNEGNDGDGGYLVPDLIAGTVLDVMETHGLALKVAQVLRTDADSLDVPKRSTGPSVKYPGEASLIDESSSTFEQVQLTPRKRACLTYLSNEFLSDAVIQAADFAMREIGRELALNMDNELINGDGGASYGSVTGLAAALGDGGSVAAASSWDAFTLSHFASLVAALADKYHPNASWIMSRAFFAQTIERLLFAATGTGAPDVVEGVAGSKMLFGRPVNFCDFAPRSDADSTEACFFGDFRESVLIAMRQDVRLEKSEHYRFAYDQLAIRATARYDLNVHRGGTHAAADGYVGLRETS